MALKFGTSGVRGLVTEMTDAECYLYTRAFADYVKSRTDTVKISLAGDYRSSTPRIKEAVVFGLQHEGLDVDNCGSVGTPAVTYHAMQNGIPSVMVTGSHIPDDRNGIKFNMPWGEVLKDDEAEISRRYSDLKSAMEPEFGTERSQFGEDGMLKPSVSIAMHVVSLDAQKEYMARFSDFFPEGCLEGMKVVVYQHSSVSRDVIPEILTLLGAKTVNVGRSDSFVPVDTEAVEEPGRLAAWVAEHAADALVTADGDADRPLVVDENGRVIRGDVLGIVVADFLGADAVSAPVSCNTAVEKCGRFARVSRTKIGSPYVITSMKDAVEAGARTVVGYEANGGFLTATDIKNKDTGNVLKALPTRDALLPILCALAAGKRQGGVSVPVSGLPARYTFSGLLREFPSEKGGAVVSAFKREGNRLAEKYFRKAFGRVDSIDFTDGARITFKTQDVVHLRPSGNAPEFRCYTESDTEENAAAKNAAVLAMVRDIIVPEMT